MVMFMDVLVGVMATSVIVHMRLGVAVASAKKHSHGRSNDTRRYDPIVCAHAVSPWG